MEAKTVKSNMTDMTQGSPAGLILFFRRNDSVSGSFALLSHFFFQNLTYPDLIMITNNYRPFSRNLP